MNSNQTNKPPQDWRERFDNDIPALLQADENTLEYLRGRFEEEIEAARQEERQRIVKMIEKKLNHWEKIHDESMPRNTLIAYHADSCIRALNDLKAKLTEQSET